MGLPITLVEVPFMAGDDRHPAAAGPGRVADAWLRPPGPINVVRVERDGPFRDTGSAALSVNRALTGAVREALAAGRRPIVLAGSCDSSLGVLGGFDHASTGVVWIDAHGDFNTPDTTSSGFFPGMSLAIAAGDCYADWWAGIGNNRPIDRRATVLLGTRELDPAERIRLGESGISVVEWRAGGPVADPAVALAGLADRVGRVYLHLDLDGLDPSIAPGVVDEPVPGGLTLGDVGAILEDVLARFDLVAATIATYNPARDADDRTLRTVITIIERLTA